MKLWTYQHPIVLETLQSGKIYTCAWAWAPGERWQKAFRWMGERMVARGIPLGESAPVWAWHSVNRLGRKPDEDCANALLFDYQLELGVVLLELEAPDHLVLTSDYGVWNEVLVTFLDGTEPAEADVARCFSVHLRPRRGRPPQYFSPIQACIPYIEPGWLVAWERLDTEKILRERRDLWQSLQE